jgi:hypothetical protein
VGSATPGGTDVFTVAGVSDDGTSGGTIEVQSGTLAVQGDFTQNDGGITVDAGQTLTVTGNLTVGGGTLSDAGAITAGTYTQSAPATLALVLGNGSGAPLSVSGPVSLAGALSLSWLSPPPSPPSSITLINNTGSSPVSGTFQGLPQGATVYLSGTAYTISYTGGDGNDVVLTGGATAVVSGVSPSSGPTSGGTSVTISGSGFTGATAVYFGTTAATSFTVTSDGSITAVAPAGAPGSINVTVQTSGGTSATSSADQFTYIYTPSPVITGLSVSSGPSSGGTTVTIYGYALNGATAVYFGGVAATSFTVNPDGSITVTAPAHSPGLVDIQVVTSAGTSDPTSADQFTYT